MGRGADRWGIGGSTRVGAWGVSPIGGWGWWYGGARGVRGEASARTHARRRARREEITTRGAYLVAVEPSERANEHDDVELDDAKRTMSSSTSRAAKTRAAFLKCASPVAAATPRFPPPSPKSTETAVNAPLVARRHNAARIRPKSQQDAVGGSCAPGPCWRSDPALVPGRRSPVGACALGRVVVAQATLSGASSA